MASLDSPPFPSDISYGVAFGPEFVTEIAVVSGGAEQRNRLRQRALCVGDCAHAIKTQAQLDALIQFFRSMGGRLHSFRFKDWSDFNVSAGVVTQYGPNGAALGAGVFQLAKLYQTAVNFSETRLITKPVAASVVLKDGATTLNSPTDYTLNGATGQVTVAATQTRAVSSHTVGAAHQVVLASALAPLPSIGDQVWLSGVTGTAAALLNGAQTVTAVAGATVTLSVGTAGLTASGGTLTVYRQAGNLSWAGQFDVHCRFDTDRLSATIENLNLYTWGQIPIVEVAA